MKKILCALTLILITASFCTPVKEWIYPVKKISKHINLQVALSKAYQHKVYAQSSVALHVTIMKVRENGVDTLLTKEYPKILLGPISHAATGFSRVIHIAGVADSKEQIILLYTVDYKSKGGGDLPVPYFYPVPKGTVPTKVIVNI